MTTDFELLGFSAADAEDMRALFKWFREQGGNLRRTPVPPALAAAPHVYLAVSPDGIPAMQDQVGTGTGSLYGVGTGTDASVGVISKDDDCRLYRIDDRGQEAGGKADVDPIGVKRTVYNPSTTAVPAGTLFLAVKTADGKYQAVPLGGTTAAPSGGEPVQLSWTEKTQTAGSTQLLVTAELVEDGLYEFHVHIPTRIDNTLGSVVTNAMPATRSYLEVNIPSAGAGDLWGGWDATATLIKIGGGQFNHFVANGQTSFTVSGSFWVRVVGASVSSPVDITCNYRTGTNTNINEVILASGTITYRRIGD